MINLAFTVGSLVVLLIAVFVRERTLDLPREPHQVLADTTELPSSTPNPTKTPTVAVMESDIFKSPTPSVQPTATATPVVNLSSTDSWKYPNASVTTENPLKLSTGDTPKLVVTWYKDQISKRGYHATSVIQTSTNGKVLDKVVAGNNDGQITIEITQENPTSQTIILITKEDSSQAI